MSENLDWIDEIQAFAKAKVIENQALGFWGMILLKGGKAVSIAAGHPELPEIHLLEHAAKCLVEDKQAVEMK